LLTLKQKEYLANTTIRSTEGVGVNPSHHNIRKLVENGVLVGELQTEIKSGTGSLRLNHREQRKVASKEGRDMRRIIKTLEENTARTEDRYEGQSLFSSAIFKRRPPDSTSSGKFTRMVCPMAHTTPNSNRVLLILFKRPHL
jgi:hypothetical protein